jgi:hypothetical protein
MAEQEIKLTKNIISNQEAQKLYEEAFDEVIISDEEYDDDKLINIYNDLFYQITKRGKKSHEEIVSKSYDIVHPEYKQNLEDKIVIKNNVLIDKNNELLELTNPPHISQHPYFSNGEFIQQGEVITQTPTGDSIWFIQKGFKRYVSAMWLIRILRKSLGEKLYRSNGQYIPLNLSMNFKLAHADQINSILEAQDITGGASLAIPEKDLVAKEIQSYIYSQLLVEFECHGVERYYKFTTTERNDISSLLGRQAPAGYWWIDQQGSCQLTYQTDQDPTEDFVPETHTITWSPSTGRYHAKRHISRDYSLYSAGSDAVSEEFYQRPLNTRYFTRDPDTYTQEYPLIRERKEWGEPMISKFPQVINIRQGSIIGAKIFNPTKADGSPINPSGFTMLSGIDKVGDQADIFSNNPFERYSDYGNRMINPYCYGSAQESCWGAITTTQPVNLDPSDINERLAKLFSNPGGRYYQIDKEKEHKNRKVRGKVYGQPILYVKSKLCVFLGANRKTLTDWNYFYNLEDGGGIYLKNRKLDDHVRGYKRDSHALFNWFRTSNSSPVGYKNNPTLVFPGLKGMKINDRNSDLDVRPSGGVDRPSSKFEEAVLDTIYESNLSHSSNGEGNPIDDNPFNPGIKYKLGWEYLSINSNTGVVGQSSTTINVYGAEETELEPGDDLGSNYGPKWKSIWEDHFKFKKPGYDW